MADPEYVSRLIRTYQQAQAALVQIIIAKKARGNLTNYEYALLAQVNAVLRETDQQAVSWSRVVIPDQYKIGVTEAVQGLKRYGIDASGYQAFSRLHTRAVDILVRNTIEDLTDATNFVGRQIQDTVREAGLEAVTQKTTTGSTVEQTKRILQEKLVDRGLNGIRDRRGRLISLDAYASTVARSTTREATNQATINHLQSLGYDLVKMSEHRTACPVCAALQGRVYSLSGNTAGYPVLTRAYGSHANIHPNCRHVIFPYVADLADDPERDSNLSNRPFDIDPRSQAEMDRYNAQQKEKRQLRSDRNQYQRYQFALGDDAPKTFAEFRRMKSSNSERWQEITSEYKSVIMELR